MTDDRSDSQLQWFEQADGSTALLPAHHDDRVAQLTVALGAARDDKAAVLLLLEVKADAGLDANYGSIVMVQAVEKLFYTLLHGATPFEVVLIGSRLPALINAAKAPLAQDSRPGSRDGR